MSRKKSETSGYRRAAGELALLVLPACVLLLWLLNAQTERALDVTDLKIHVAHLASLSSEEELLAERTLAEPVTANYFDVHTRMLRRKIDEEVTALHSSDPGAGLGPAYRRAGILSHRLAATAQQLASSFQAPAALKAARAQLGLIESTSRELEQTLAREQD